MKAIKFDHYDCNYIYKYKHAEKCEIYDKLTENIAKTDKRFTHTHTNTQMHADLLIFYLE